MSELTIVAIVIITGLVLLAALSIVKDILTTREDRPEWSYTHLKETFYWECPKGDLELCGSDGDVLKKIEVLHMNLHHQRARQPKETNVKMLVVQVTEDNHEWASEITGMSVEQVARRYQVAVDEGIICTIKVPA